MSERIRIRVALTGFEFVRAGDATELWLKTRAGDIRGPFLTTPMLDAVAIVLVGADPGPVTPEAWSQAAQALHTSGVAVYRPALRMPDHPVEALHDALAAARFFEDFGIERLVFAGAGVPGGAALAAAQAVSARAGVLAVDPRGMPQAGQRPLTDIELWWSSTAEPAALAYGEPTTRVLTGLGVTPTAGQDPAAALVRVLPRGSAPD